MYHVDLVLCAAIVLTGCAGGASRARATQQRPQPSVESEPEPERQPELVLPEGELTPERFCVELDRLLRTNATRCCGTMEEAAPADGPNLLSVCRMIFATDQFRDGRLVFLQDRARGLLTAMHECGIVPRESMASVFEGTVQAGGACKISSADIERWVCAPGLVCRSLEPEGEASCGDPAREGEYCDPWVCGEGLGCDRERAAGVYVYRCRPLRDDGEPCAAAWTCSGGDCVEGRCAQLRPKPLSEQCD